jgi:hypothetical protein
MAKAAFKLIPAMRVEALKERTVRVPSCAGAALATSLAIRRIRRWMLCRTGSWVRKRLARLIKFMIVRN